MSEHVPSIVELCNNLIRAAATLAAREELVSLIQAIPQSVMEDILPTVTGNFCVVVESERAVYESALLDWLAGKGYFVQLAPSKDGYYLVTAARGWPLGCQLTDTPYAPTRLTALVECVKHVAAREAKQP